MGSEKGGSWPEINAGSGGDIRLDDKSQFSQKRRNQLYRASFFLKKALFFGKIGF